jgi:hypothetical protein
VIYHTTATQGLMNQDALKVYCTLNNPIKYFATANGKRASAKAGIQG